MAIKKIIPPLLQLLFLSNLFAQGGTTVLLVGEKQPPPNIVLIFTDDMGYADVPGFGTDEPNLPLPGIDRLAAEGVSFSNAYVSAPICQPSRQGLMTGRHQARWQVYENEMGKFASEGGPTIGELLKLQGYATGMFGKWHISGKGSGFSTMGEGAPDERGFDEVACIPYGMTYQNFGPTLYVGNGVQQTFDKTVYTTDYFGERGVAFIEEHAGNQPFFLCLSFNAPHAPLQAWEDDIADFDGEIPNMNRREYAAMMSAVDRAVRNVLDKLDELGQTENTLVIFTNDNGGPGGTDGGPGNIMRSNSANASFNTPLRGFKFDCWEGGIRVPMIYRMPGRFAAGEIREGMMTSTMDLLPTILAVGGFVELIPNNLDGVNILPQILGQSADSPHSILCWEMEGSRTNEYELWADDPDATFPWRDYQQLAIRKDRWKLIDPLFPDSEPLANAKWQLYDLSVDPGESNDLAAQHPDIVAQLAADFADWRAEVKSKN